MLTPELNHVLAGRDLSASEMENVMEKLASGKIADAQAGAFLSALRIKGETVDELTGAARFLRRQCEFIDCGVNAVIDTCGTGGDGTSTFNISTTAALVAAGAGVPVAKHGNRSVSSRCGSADLLAELGFDLEASSEVMEESIRDNGIGFLFAQKMHPVLGKLAPLRKALKIRTIFNLLGPLVNPAGASAQLLGVYDAALTERFASVLKSLGERHAMVVHGHDGLDEITCCAATRVSELKNGSIQTYDLFPELLLGRTFEPEEIRGGDAVENAAITRAVLDGTERGACRAVTVLNAGAAIYTADHAATLEAGIRMAEESIDSGSAREKLNALIRSSKS